MPARADGLGMFGGLGAVPRYVLIGALCLLAVVLRADPARPVVWLGRRLVSAPGRLPRLAVLALVCLLATGAIAFAAGQQKANSSTARAAAPAKPSVLVVPDVRGHVYVFAKGMLDDAGFAWRVAGDVEGYAANRVASQSPLPGTRVFDTGSPTITLELAESGQYGEQGAPENVSPYTGTPVELVGGGASVATGGGRPPAFDVPGAPKESMKQPALPERARMLAAWLEKHRTPTRANIRHWRYEHRWIVAGAKFGWWRGAEALQTLIRVDRRVQALWGMGSSRRAVAEDALAQVRDRAR